MSREMQLHDVRELLQYVPKFVGKTFAIELRWKVLSDHLKSEMMLDLSMLQQVGVKLIFVIEEEVIDDFVDWSIDVDLKLEREVQLSPEGILSVLERGQFAIFPTEGDYLSKEVVSVFSEIEVNKVLILLHESESLPAERGISVALKDWQGSDRNAAFSNAIPVILESGVSRVHFLDSAVPGVILSELFSNEGRGLMIYRDSYRKIRPIRAEDIPELLTLIGRSVRTSLLVPRKYEDIESSLSDYFLYQIDENVVGCVALHKYDDAVAEIACLYVKHGHQGLGYGEELVRFAEEQAKQLKVKRVFALTTLAKSFFEKTLDYEQIELHSIPDERLKALQESGRSSLAMQKVF